MMEGYDSEHKVLTIRLHWKGGYTFDQAVSIIPQSILVFLIPGTIACGGPSEVPRTST